MLSGTKAKRAVMAILSSPPPSERREPRRQSAATVTRIRRHRGRLHGRARRAARSCAGRTRRRWVELARTLEEHFDGGGAAGRLDARRSGPRGERATRRRVAARCWSTAPARTRCRAGAPGQFGSSSAPRSASRDVQACRLRRPTSPRRPGRCSAPAAGRRRARCTPHVRRRGPARRISTSSCLGVRRDRHACFPDRLDGHRLRLLRRRDARSRHQAVALDGGDAGCGERLRRSTGGGVSVDYDRRSAHEPPGTFTSRALDAGPAPR